VHAAITLDAAWLAAVLLLSLRLAGTLLFTPILAPASVPLPVRVIVVLGLSATLTLALPQGAGGPPAAGVAAAGLGGLLQACLTELALGATLALGILLAFAAVGLAGQLIGIQMGFGLGQVIDPASNASMPVVASALQQTAVLVFFLVDGHHALLRGVAWGLARFPLGQPWPLAGAHEAVVRQVAGLFSLGFALAAPVVFSLLLVELALGVVSRNLPQVNMLAVGIPVKVVAGLVALALWASGMGEVLGRVYGSIYRTWDTVFAVRAGAPGPALALGGDLSRWGRAG
jgi:flagellar biosynthetic protein FliR